jgi:hypothetical protein
MRKIALWAVVATKLPSCKSDTFYGGVADKKGAKVFRCVRG